MKSITGLKHTLTGQYTGYFPTGIWQSDKKPATWENCRKLKRIPKKISYFFDKTKIMEVRKSNCYKNPLDNYYLIELSYGTYLEVEY